jgi:riboflavin-specific deaminase-like protein
MQQALVTEAVWRRVLALRDDAGAVGPVEALPACGEPTVRAAAEAAAFALYQPLAAARGPFLVAQVGQSLDGRVATVSGDARDISGHDGLRHLHRCRALLDAVVVGATTVLHDDPRLTVRLVEGPNPARVVIDPRGRVPGTAQVFAEDGVRRIVIQATDTPRPSGVEVVRLPAIDGWISPGAILKVLARRGLGRLLIEGGGVTIARFLEANLLHRLHVSVAPLIIGAGPAGLRTTPVPRLADALRPETFVYGLGTDVVFDCALAQSGSASTSPWPTVQEEAPLAARRA